jgi:hypothetical protein
LFVLFLGVKSKLIKKEKAMEINTSSHETERKFHPFKLDDLKHPTGCIRMPEGCHRVGPEGDCFHPENPTRVCVNQEPTHFIFY